MDKKGDVRHGIRRHDDNKTCSSTSTDQLVSAQVGLVPQTSGKLTGNLIWGSNIMFDHFSNFISVHPMSYIPGEETLEEKIAYDRQSASHGVIFKIYHADNGRYTEQMFLDAVEDANQDINFFAVGAHQ